MEASETPELVYQMKKQVDSFREKLEVKGKGGVVVQWLEKMSLPQTNEPHSGALRLQVLMKIFSHECSH